MNISSAIRTGGALALTALLVGCASGPKSIYSWNSYQTQVYSYLKSDGPAQEEQIQELEKGVQQTAGKDARLPPGYQAHLGLLYLNAGRTDQALAAWEQEKQQFPESAPYINYLVSNLKKNGN
ncbi:MAG: DUF4810 domain-containing protein [Comamonas sp.]